MLIYIYIYIDCEGVEGQESEEKIEKEEEEVHSLRVLRTCLYPVKISSKEGEVVSGKREGVELVFGGRYQAKRMQQKGSSECKRINSQRGSGE